MLFNPDRKKAIFHAKRAIAQSVTDVVNLEDINYTVPEVQTLMDGITVGGHKIQDELITLNQVKAWNFLFASLENNQFVLSDEYLFKLHNLVANQEALEYGKFRSGQVSISGTSYIPPKASELDSIWNELVIKIKPGCVAEQNESTQLIKTKAYQVSMYLFAEMARNQFFYDGNKRTARMMMAGILLDLGYPLINVPAARKQEFNQLMIEYYETQNFDKLSRFLFSCIDAWLVEEFCKN